MNATEGTPTPGEMRIARLVGIPVESLRYWALEIWGKPFERYRDELAGKGATLHKRDRISRAIVKEIYANYMFWKVEQ